MLLKMRKIVKGELKRQCDQNPTSLKCLLNGFSSGHQDTYTWKLAQCCLLSLVLISAVRPESSSNDSAPFRPCFSSEATEFKPFLLSEKPSCVDFSVFLAKFLHLRRGSKEKVQSPSQLWEMLSRELGDINYVVVTPPGRPGNLPVCGALGKNQWTLVSRICCVRCN